MTGSPNKLSAVAGEPLMLCNSILHRIYIVTRHWFVIQSHMCVILTFLAPIAFIAGQAEAEERVNFVDAGASVLTRLRLAVVYICKEEQEAWGSRWGSD